METLFFPWFLGRHPSVLCCYHRVDHSNWAMSIPIDNYFSSSSSCWVLILKGQQLEFWTMLLQVATDVLNGNLCCILQLHQGISPIFCWNCVKIDHHVLWTNCYQLLSCHGWSIHIKLLGLDQKILVIVGALGNLIGNLKGKELPNVWVKVKLYKICRGLVRCGNGVENQMGEIC